MKPSTYMTAADIRQAYLKFFESKGHTIVKSSPVVPKDDPTLLFTNAGMNQFKANFLGLDKSLHRATTSQKCIRAGGKHNDLDNVGYTARHHTFFEMLGNFSFGDYFKHDAIHWAWELLTTVYKLPPERLWVTVYFEDDEAYNIWLNEIHVPAERIIRIGDNKGARYMSDNFWMMGDTGPCGPCSEIFYDRGPSVQGGPPGSPDEDGDRYMEIWNNVFTQFDNDGHNNYTELEQKNIDTGMGLERLACIVQDVDSMFDIDTMKELRDHVCRLAGVEYGESPEKDISLRVITDHIRSVTFMISDGILPSNSGRGYVLRRLLRRASRHGRLLGIDRQFLEELAETVIEGSKDGYPELEEKKEFIFKVIVKEEEQFNKTIDQGLSILAQAVEEMEQKNEKVMSGEEAFRLYDTYGFPVDLTIEILEEKGFSIDEEGFQKAAKEQKEKAKGTFGEHNYSGREANVYDEIDPEITSTFVGYDETVYDSKVTVLTTDTEIVDALSDGEEGTILVEETPFYATSGGQEADTGVILGEDFEFAVEDTMKLSGGKIGHKGHVVKGMVKTGDTVTLKIDTERRRLSANNHSATHLLQKALRTVLGSHVEQAGSSVNADRLRFDFTHFSAMTEEEIQKVEAIVNEQIRAALPVKAENMPIEEARKTGAAALFGEKYGDVVRVVSMGEFSKEFCGGTHVENTSAIMAFKIVSETGVAAGVRRIEALTSKGLMDYYHAVEEQLHYAAKLMKAKPEQLADKIQHLMAENKALGSEVESLKSKMAKDAMGNVMDQVQEVTGVKLLATSVEGVDMNGLRDLGDQLKEKLGEGVILLVSASGEKVNLMAMATEDAVSQGAHAGNLIKACAACVGGGGGGRPNMAQAGGKNPAGVQDALEKAVEVLKEQLS